MKISRIRIAAVLVSFVAIIGAGSMNMAGAASGPPPAPTAECNTLGCKGAPATAPEDLAAEQQKASEIEAAKEAAQQAVKDDEAARKAEKAKPTVEKPKASPVVEDTAAEPAPVVKVQCG